MSCPAQCLWSSLRRSDFAPDRTVAGVDLAINLGLTAIWALAVFRVADGAALTSWFAGSWLDVVYVFFALAVDAWLDVGIYGGRRWAFAGKAIFGTQRGLQAAHSQEWPACALCVAVAVYALMRLVPLIGPRSEAPCGIPCFLPDRLVGGGFFLLNVYTLGRWLVRTVPAGTFPMNLATAWYLVGTLLILWLNVGLFKSRGWAVGGGLFFATVFALQQLHRFPEAAPILNALCLVYLGFRLNGWGPKVEGPLGLRSA